MQPRGVTFYALPVLMLAPGFVVVCDFSIIIILFYGLLAGWLCWLALLAGFAGWLCWLAGWLAKDTKDTKDTNDTNDTK